MRVNTLLPYLALIVALFAPAVAANAWSTVAGPVTGPARAIGRYEAGCLAGAVALAPNGPGLHVTRLERYRYFGHPSLIRFLQALGQQVRASGLGSLLIGDLAQPRGGPMPYGHRSHQIGLDADIWFMRLDGSHARVFPGHDTLQPASMLTQDGHDLAIDRWSPATATVLKMAASFPEVERVFVNPVIKRELCRQSRDLVWLRKLRPWWGHDDHYHVRLSCPADSPDCVAQEPLPPGPGCGAELDWWFSAEAHHKGGSDRAVPPPPPPACDPVLLDGD